MAESSLTPVDQLIVDATERRASRREILKRAVALGLSAPVVGMLLAACGGDDDDPTATSGTGTGEATATTGGEAPTATTGGSAPTATTGGSGAAGEGKIVISLAAEPATLETWNAYSTDGYPVIRNVCEALLNRNPETNELVGELATGWEQIDDTTWHFSLREGATFHNGEALTGDVAAYGINWTWSPDNAFDIIQTMGPQITAEGVDETTVAVMTAEPDPILPNRLYFAPLPSMQQIEEDIDSMRTAPIGTGPYMNVEWAAGEYIRAVANPDWWGNGADDAYGAISIAEVEWVFRTESSVRAAQVQTGEAQLARFLAPEDMETVPVGLESPSVETVFLRFDTNHPAMSDIRVREAIAHAVDKDTLAEQIFGGGTPATQLVGPSAFGYNPDIPQPGYDMEAAVALLEEAGADGVEVDAPVVITVRRGNYNRNEELGEYVTNQLNEIGMTASMEVIEVEAYQEQYVINLADVPPDRGWITTLPHGNEMMDLGQSFGYYTCDGAVSTFCDPALDEMIAEVEPLVGEERQAGLAEVTDVYMAAYPILPIVHMPLFWGLAENLNWAPRLDGFILVKEMSYS